MAGGLMRAESILLALILASAASLGIAQGLRDPTRPSAISAKGASRSAATQTGWVLQSVLISPERRYAIINGEVVPVGGSVAGAEVIAIAEERVTLRTADGLRILHLFPDVTRLGAGVTGGARTTTPRAQQDPKEQRSGKPGIKNANEN
ncbi:MAG: MSHA biogenesis protein MshK [Betaproteobacteria bacterium]